jgi:hypothetical protein
VPSLSHLTSCKPTKSNLYLANSLAATAVHELALYRLITSQVPNLMLLSLLRLYQSTSPGPRLCLWIFRNKICFNREELLALLAGCLRLLIQYIRNYPPYRRPFLHPQPQNATCHDARDPLITEWLVTHMYARACTHTHVNTEPLCVLWWLIPHPIVFAIYYGSLKRNDK